MWTLDFFKNCFVVETLTFTISMFSFKAEVHEGEGSGEFN